MDSFLASQIAKIKCVRENFDEIIRECPYCHVGGETLAIYQDGLCYYVACANCDARGGDCGHAEMALSSWNLPAIMVQVYLNPEI